MEVMELSKVTAKYQVTIPVNVRKELGISGRFRGKATTMEYMDEVRGNVN
jgi:bifunctional DNA-binding transcriptional regulator/antitoxin component of YhaV-PrlF toxin-antitoxin module